MQLDSGEALFVCQLLENGDNLLADSGFAVRLKNTDTLQLSFSVKSADPPCSCWLSVSISQYMPAFALQCIEFIEFISKRYPCSSTKTRFLIENAASSSSGNAITCTFILSSILSAHINHLQSINKNNIVVNAIKISIERGAPLCALLVQSDCSTLATIRNFWGSDEAWNNRHCRFIYYPGFWEAVKLHCCSGCWITGKARGCVRRLS